MSINNTHTITLDTAEIRTIICGLQWSINHHNSLDLSVFDGQEEKTEILDRHNRLKAMFQSKLDRSYPKDNQETSLRKETLCPCPPETSSLLDDVDGGILKCLQCNKFTNGYELDANNGYCNTCCAEPEPLSEFHGKYVCVKYVDGHCIRWESRKPMVK